MENLFGNALILASAYGICLLVGLLLYRPLRADAFDPARFACYPVLGFATLLVACSYLRIPSVPFSKTAVPLAVALLLLGCGLEIARIRFGRVRFWESLAHSWQKVLFVAGTVLLFGLPLTFRMCVPEMLNPGTWGYDQVNYVVTARGYVDRGMLPQTSPDSPGYLDELDSFWKYQRLMAESILRGEPLKVPSDEFSQSSIGSTARVLRMLPRNAGACVDAFFSVVLRIHPVQAYFLSVLLITVLLVHATLALAMSLRLPMGAVMIVVAIGVFWPTAVRPVMYDNRDQAACLVLMIAILALARGRASWWVIRAVLFAAICFVYIEIAPFAALAYAIFAFHGQTFRTWWSAMLKEGGVTFASILLFLPSFASYLLYQTSSGNTSDQLVPLRAPFGVFENLAGTFAALLPQPGSFHMLLLGVSGFALLFIILTGGIRSSLRGDWSFVGALVLLCALDLLFMSKGKDYAAYKLGTVSFPFALIAVGSALQPLQTNLRRWDTITAQAARGLCYLLPAAILCGIAMRAEFYLPDLGFHVGVNSELSQRKKFTLEEAWSDRSNDVVSIQKLLRKVIKEDRSVIVGATRSDIGFVQQLIDPKRAYIVNGVGAQVDKRPDSLTCEEMSFLPEGKKIRHILLTNWEFAMHRYHLLESMIPIVNWPLSQKVFNRFSHFSIDGKRPFVFAALHYSEMQPVAEPADGSSRGFNFGPQGVVFGVYALNCPSIPRDLRVSVVPLNARAAQEIESNGQRFSLYVNGKKAVEVRTEAADGSLSFEIPLDATPSGHTIAVRPLGESSVKSDDYTMPPRAASDDIPYYRIQSFAVDPIP